MHLRNVLVINAHSCRNAGDMALLQVAIDQIRRLGKVDNIIISLDDLDYYPGRERIVGSLFTWIKQGGRWHINRLLYLSVSAIASILSYRYLKHTLFFPMPYEWRETIEAYLQADVVFTKPGGFLYSSGRGLSLVLSLYSMLLALLAGKPLYVFPQSIGPLRYPWERILIRFIFSKARIGFVREPVSQITLQECGLQPEKFRLVPDMAFAFHSASANEAKEWLRNFEGIDMDSQEQPLMGITVVNWGGQNKNFRFQQRYEDACTAAIRLFLEKFQGKVFFFPQVCGPLDIQDDRVIARKIRGRLSNSTRCVVLEKQPPPQILKTLYGFMDVFIATRLHSAIFAWSQGIPTIAISYQPKTRGVAQMLGLEDWVIRIEDITSESLSDTLTALWEMRESLKAHLQQVIPNLIKQIDSIGDWIAQDLEELANAHKNQSS